MENENKNIKFEDYKKILRATIMTNDEILNKNLNQLLEYRKMVAINLLDNNLDENHKLHIDMYNRSQQMLKDLLAIT